MSERKIVHESWLESERGWGVRPDGYSLHLSDEDRVSFIEAYWDTMPDEVPDEYSRPAGDPKSQAVSHEDYQKLLEARHRGEYGLRFY